MPVAARSVTAALGDARTVLNVGAGAGSYEPADRQVTAVEPSASMRAQRPVDRPAIDATAEHLPFPDDSFDAAMATFTVHQWRDLPAGLTELRRVTRGPLAILTCDPALIHRFWLREYVIEVLDVEARRYPPIETLTAGLGAGTEVVGVPIPRDCADGFTEAYYARPEMLLNPAALHACSAWSFLDAATLDRFRARLARDLAEGTWDHRHGALRAQPEFDGSLVLLVAR